MIKNKSFFLLVLFSLFALNGHNHEHKEHGHKRYEHKKSLVEKLIKTVTAGFILSHACPLFVDIQDALLHISKQKSPLMSLINEIKSGYHVLQGFRNISKHCKQAPAYILAVASAQALTALISKPIF